MVVLERVPDIEDYLQAADLGLFASDSESFCLSILEAMCFGCPSVATRVGGIPEVVEDGVTGVLVAPGDAAALARAVETLIADPALRMTLGEASDREVRVSRPTSSSLSTRRSTAGFATPSKRPVHKLGRQKRGRVTAFVGPCSSSGNRPGITS